MKLARLAGASALALGLAAGGAAAQQVSGDVTGSTVFPHETGFRDLGEIVQSPNVLDEGDDATTRSEMRDWAPPGREPDATVRDYDRTWSPGEGEEFHRGDLEPDPQADESARRDSSRQNGGLDDRADEDDIAEAREDRQVLDRDARGDRRERLVAIALVSAVRAFPQAKFTHFRFGIEEGRRVIQLQGADRRSGREVQVDVFPSGAIQSLSQEIPLAAVPQAVRSAVRGEMGPMRVSQVSRTLERDLDFHYAFEGLARSGRPVRVEIGADGTGLRIAYGDRDSAG